MRKIVAIALMLTIMTAMAGCGAKEQTAETPAAATPAPTPTPKTTDIGFCLANSGPFSAQLKSDIEAECAALGCQVEIIVCDTAQQQQDSIASLLLLSAAVIVIEPVDVDALDEVLKQCETQGVRVINLVDAINGKTDMLISPDYTRAGEAAAACANRLLPQGNCLALKLSVDSFVMQMLSDGFAAELGSGITTAEAYCGDDEESAYNAVKAALQQGSAGLIFAQSAALAKGAMRVAGETGGDVPLVVFGGDMETVASIASGEADAAVFFGPAETAKQAVYYADQMMKDSAFVAPQYVELTLETIDADNAAEYQTEAVYAQVKGVG